MDAPKLPPARDYQEPDDPPHLWRVDSSWPGDVETLRGCKEVAVVGVSRRQEDLRAFLASDVRVVVLEREPANPKDPNAVAVAAMWRGDDGYARLGHLGYVPAEFAQELGRLPAATFLHARPVLYFKARDEEGMDAGLRIAIGTSETLSSMKVDVPLDAKPTEKAQAIARTEAPSRGGCLGLIAFMAVAVVLAACGGDAEPEGLTTIQREALVAIADALDRGQDWDARLTPAYQVALQDLKKGLGEPATMSFESRVRSAETTAKTIRIVLDTAKMKGQLKEDAGVELAQAREMTIDLEDFTIALRRGELKATPREAR